MLQENTNNNLSLDTALQKNLQLECQLKIELEKYRMIADNINCGLWEYDIASHALFQSKKLDGKWSQNNLVVEHYRDTMKGWGLIHPDDVGVFDKYCDSMDNGDEHFEYDIRMIGDKPEYMWFRYIGNAVFDDDGKAFRVVGKTLDVTKEKNDISDKQKKSQIDPLTQVYNKTSAKQMIENVLTVSASHNFCHMMIIIDADNFKEINNKWGHLYGDYVLEAAAARISGTFSSTDIVGRIGGDEFVVFCPDISNPDKDVPKICDRLLSRLKGIILKDGQNLSVSIGVALSPKHGTTYESLYRCADIALYQAKRTGKSSAAIYSRFTTYETSVGETSLKKTSHTPNDISVTHLVDIEKNLFDYAFDVISDDANFTQSLYTVCSEIGKYFDLDKISVVENNHLLHEIILLSTWHRNSSGYKADPITDLYKLYWEEVENRYYGGKTFYEYHVNGDNKSRFHKSEIFKDENICSMIQFPVMDGAELVGVINFEDRTKTREWTEKEIATLSSITKIISSNLLRIRSKSELEDEILYTGNAMDSQKLTYYVINPQTHIIKYVSRYATDLFPDIKVGQKCYSSVFGLNEPCSMCPSLSVNEGCRQFTLETYGEKYDSWFSTTASMVERKGYAPEHLVCWKDVTAFIERVKAKDHLTGAMSFEKFKAVALKKYISNTDTNKNYYVVIVGMRRFSDINEEFGYAVGDDVLKTAAECYSNILLEDELLCRIKGDDFILFLNNSGPEILDRMQNACLSLEIMMRGKYPAMNIRCLGGIYEIAHSDTSITSIIDKANVARHKAGEYFTTDVHHFGQYDEETETQMINEHELELAMENAIKTNQFQVYLQPKVDMGTDKIGGAEALVRWITPDGTIIPNYKFIPLFEKNGFIVQLDKFVYNETMRLMRRWIDMGKDVPLVSINVSRLHLFDENFPEYLVGLTEKYGVPRKLIEIEITESVFFDNTERLIEMISRLQKSGFVISMDDFGTGYSTLSLMKSLPIDIIKIDGSFFLDSALDEKNKAIISSIIHLSKKLNLKIVSEGIETAEQVEFIKSEHCDYAQGFLYYKPISSDEFEKLI